jgi:hypothetical protein
VQVVATRPDVNVAPRVSWAPFTYCKVRQNLGIPRWYGYRTPEKGEERDDFGEVNEVHDHGRGCCSVAIAFPVG